MKLSKLFIKVFFQRKKSGGLEAVLDGGEEGARADVEFVFGTGEGTIGYVVVGMSVEEVGDGEGETDFAV